MIDFLINLNASLFYFFMNPSEPLFELPSGFAWFELFIFWSAFVRDVISDARTFILIYIYIYFLGPYKLVGVQFECAKLQ